MVWTPQENLFVNATPIVAIVVFHQTNTLFLHMFFMIAAGVLGDDNLGSQVQRELHREALELHDVLHAARGAAAAGGRLEGPRIGFLVVFLISFFL